MNIPLISFDNFYKDPDKIREYALGLDFKAQGHFPGLRTDPIHELDEYMFTQMSSKFLSLITVPEEGFNGTITTAFQKIKSYHSEMASPLNRGLIHNDTGCFCAGLVYLNPNPTLGSGTSLYRLIPDEFDEHVSYEAHNAQFETTAEIKNVYNRCVIYDAQEWHSHTNCWMDEEDRLTQVFFVNSFEVRERIASERCRSYDL